jgi:hypothetical protein
MRFFLVMVQVWQLHMSHPDIAATLKILMEKNRFLAFYSLMVNGLV